MTVSCDSKCEKAWGRNSRPTLGLNPESDDYLPDDQLGIAPADPGTYEGGVGKPSDPSQFPNKWCVRECERCQVNS